MLRSSIVALLLVAPSSLVAQQAPWKSAEHVSTRIPRPVLDNLTARGRALAAYDAAAWHGTDAVLALQPPEGSVERYLARQRPDSRWEVVFGRSSTARDTFYIAYRAVQREPGDTAYTARRLEPAEVDTGYYPLAMRALELAGEAFGPVTRRYNGAVLPVPGTAEWFVYFVPAPARAGYWPLGADARYRVSADGRALLEQRRLHNTVLEYGPPKAGSQLTAGFHSAVLADQPEDTDVFLVLTREPRVPEYIVSASFYFRIDTGGQITAYDREQRASQ